MDKIAGITAEYNPFHNGHKWQIGEIRSRLGQIPIIAVMSGHFTQRGQPAFMDKWLRAEAAVRGGVNLVIELPFHHACKSAEFFARGGTALLNATGIVTDVCFGAECDDINLLSAIAAKSVQTDFTFALKMTLREGQTYAKAVETAVRLFFPDAPSSVYQPNSILAIEYIKALNALSSPMRPVAVKRMPAGSWPDGEISDARSVRDAIIKSRCPGRDILKALPPYSAEILRNAFGNGRLLLDDGALEKIAFYRLRHLAAAKMRKIADCSEGLENRIKKAALSANSLSALIERAASRRYPQTRIMRIISQLIVSNDENPAGARAPYLRVLAFDGRGRGLIKKIQAESQSPVITNLPDFYKKKASEPAMRGIDADIKATDVFYLLLGENAAGQDFRKKPVYVS
ncbi:MAG: nucleotidyltransferase family protein [Acidaminococcales bacterium]|jgi:predicted nucleotidyltransferase|nr:nucleotidyltransferase family protein [Acidaminococcales bacterium]